MPELHLAPRPAGLGKHITEDAGQKLRRVRERLGLRVRDVEHASQLIAEKYQNDEFVVLINRISEIENHNLVPNIFKLYSLCAIYRLDFQEVLEWFQIHLPSLAADSALVEVPRTHTIGFEATSRPDVLLPVSLDPGLDIHRTTYLSRMIQRWGRLPLLFFEGLDLKEHRYGFIGTDDWFMYPLLQPGSFLLIDETRCKITNSGWTGEFDRPIYFLEQRQGYAFGWCSLNEDQLVLQPHPASGCSPRIYRYPQEIEVIGQITGVAMHITGLPRRPTHS